MSGPAESTGLCENHGVTEASGKASDARHDIVKLLRLGARHLVKQSRRQSAWHL